MLSSKIGTLIQEGRLLLYGQPKWTVGKNTCNTYEVFVGRVCWPDGRETDPQEVLELIARDEELTNRFSGWLMNEAMATAVAIGNRTDSNVTLSMNILPLYTNQPDFPRRLEEALLFADLRPEKLQLELSEAQQLNETGIQNLNLLHDEKGIGLWLANFGTGYSNLSLLNTLHVDGLELDRSFAEAVPKDDTSCKLLAAISQFALTLDLMVCAKGVETEEQMQFFEDYHYYKVQGGFIAPPMDLAALEKFIGSYAKVRQH